MMLVYAMCTPWETDKSQQAGRPNGLPALARLTACATGIAFMPPLPPAPRAGVAARRQYAGARAVLQMRHMMWTLLFLLSSDFLACMCFPVPSVMLPTLPARERHSLPIGALICPRQA